MTKRLIWNANLQMFFLIWCVLLSECLSELIYEGRKFVAQGSPFNISCLKSSYGVPKWTRNGLAVDTLGPEYVVKEKKLPNDGVRMELRVEAALWKHRGYYKCDPLSGRSHEIEIVPSRGESM
ncbi:uncharacterized protein CEXT_471011 [Caerostris extrusa]|uniref:Ig-like domain-containing protein n=1 Tax=Caerostris extrusa TaxID=172846 RepID=A0AAV4XBB8_CAEEX|nr:uncharacterized protein CEXT_471011 [Caerostris extrusa]